MKNFSKRRNLTALAAAVACLLALVCSRPPVTGAAQAPQAERVLEDRIPAHVPIKVKVKNLDREHWARDLEVEVRNTGNRPIYALDFFILMPDAKSPSGRPIGFTFYYGPDRSVTVGMRPEPEDVPLNPGETHTFKISDGEVMVWEKELTKPEGRNPKKFQVMFSMLSFGDGTGFQGTHGAAVPSRRTSKAQCIPKSGDGVAMAADPPPAYSLDSASHLPVSFLPANFLPGKAYAASPTRAARQTDMFCCSGTSCSYEKVVRDGYNCQCGKADWVQVTSCRDTEGTCGKAADRDTVCYDPTGKYEYHCPVFYITPCLSMDLE